MLIRITIFVFTLALAGCSQDTKKYEVSGSTMGTTYNVVVYDDAGKLAHSLVEGTVETSLQKVNSEFSNWDPASEVSRFNNIQTTKPVEISAGFRDMLTLAGDIHHATDGTFDLTLTTIIDLWGFGPNGKVISRPDGAAISEAMLKVGQTRVIELSADGKTLRKIEPKATIYLTAIAKGYGIDEVAKALRGIGAKNFMVEIGGDLFVEGKTNRGSDWLIGIERPEAATHGVAEVVAFTNKGMATSGDYRNYFEQDGIRYSHIFDGSTGQPISHRTASVTVIATSAAEADAWATALLAVGAERGLQLAETRGLDVLFIVREDDPSKTGFEIVTTSGFYDYLQIAEE